MTGLEILERAIAIRQIDGAAAAADYLEERGIPRALALLALVGARVAIRDHGVEISVRGGE